eukprot:365125-Chlamydomonas_euryale.AAC.9
MDSENFLNRHPWLTNMPSQGSGVALLPCSRRQPDCSPGRARMHNSVAGCRKVWVRLVRMPASGQTKRQRRSRSRLFRPCAGETYRAAIRSLPPPSPSRLSAPSRPQGLR